MIRIIGIGSPFGDDAAGLEAARRLAAAPPPGTEVIAADRPGSDLIELIDGAEATILIDAVQSGATPGTLHDIDLRDLPAAGVRLVSSHDLGVADAVQLAAALGKAPLRGRLLGIEIAADSMREPDRVSAQTRRAIDSILTPTQRARLDSAHARREAEMKKRYPNGVPQRGAPGRGSGGSMRLP